MWEVRKMTVETGNLFESIPDAAEEELFTRIVHGENVRIERIVSHGHTSPKSGWYDQNENEWVVVLKGEARISIKNGDDVLLAAGSHLNIPAHTEHKVTWTAPNTDTVWLAVHYK